MIMLNKLFLVLLGLSVVVAEDHSEHFEDSLSSPHEVTEMCLECHEEAGDSFLHSKHWTWIGTEEVPGHDEEVAFGKKNALNNFCIGLKSNYARCTSCHAGYGWKDNSFDFSDALNIDCLVCHDGTGMYKKNSKGAGMPKEDVDLLSIAQNVALPSRENCGACHFYGGGGNNVKHGDLEKALVNPSRELDVHMSADGEDFSCTECHETDDHDISGNALSTSTHGGTLSCENCHDEDPHTNYKKYLDGHSKTVACQTCHIPEFARANPTKLEWDWSQAGDKTKGVKGVVKSSLDDGTKVMTYHFKKGAFVWGKNVVPTYAWYGGTSERMILGDNIDLDSMNQITAPIGDINDENSKIFPFKIHKGKQIADKENSYLLPVHLFGKGGYWKTFDWDKSVITGAKNAGIDYSGKYTWAETEMYWKINHMVAPKEDALGCGDCHSKKHKTRFNWKALGYEGDPRYNKVSRFDN